MNGVCPRGPAYCFDHVIVLLCLLAFAISCHKIITKLCKGHRICVIGWNIYFFLKIKFITQGLLLITFFLSCWEIISFYQDSFFSYLYFDFFVCELYYVIEYLSVSRCWCFTVCMLITYVSHVYVCIWNFINKFAILYVTFFFNFLIRVSFETLTRNIFLIEMVRLSFYCMFGFH